MVDELFWEGMDGSLLRTASCPSSWEGLPHLDDTPPPLFAPDQDDDKQMDGPYMPNVDDFPIDDYSMYVETPRT